MRPYGPAELREARTTGQSTPESARAQYYLGRASWFRELAKVASSPVTRLEFEELALQYVLLSEHVDSLKRYDRRRD
jgi:hypothetical protein